MKRLLTAESGVAALEMAFIFPIFLVVLWVGAEASYHFRLENSLHRATASLTEIIANTRLAPATDDIPGETMSDRLPVLLEPSLAALRQMMAADAVKAEMGLRITYYRTPIPNAAAGQEPILFSLTAGMECKAGTLEELDVLSPPKGGGLITPDNVSKTELVRVETCYRAADERTMGKWIFPQDFTSNFVTLRKDW